MDEIENLAKVFLFNKLSRPELELLRSQMTEQTLAAGQVLEPREFWLILEGGARWVLPDCAGQELELENLEAGDYFGALNLVNPDVRGRARLKTSKEVRALCLEAAPFREFMSSRPEALFKALEAVAEEFQALDDSRRTSASRNVYAESGGKSGWGQKMADIFTSRMGSWSFIQGQTLCLAAWMAWNMVRGTSHWDPYPFIFLNLILSFQSAYAAPIIMMSQNRQAEKDRLAAEIDHQVNLQAEMTGAAVLRRIAQLEKALLGGRRNWQG